MFSALVKISEKIHTVQCLRFYTQYTQNTLSFRIIRQLKTHSPHSQFPSGFPVFYLLCFSAQLKTYVTFS